MRFIARLCPIVCCLLVVSPALADEQFFDSDGVRIRYLDRGLREGEPVVLIHGGFQNADSMWVETGVIDALDDVYRVIAPDMRGHGKSDKPYDPQEYGNAFVEDVVRLLDHLGIDRAHVVGYSMGGRIVFKLVADHPERVISAIPGGTDGEGVSSSMQGALERAAVTLKESGSIRPILEHFDADDAMSEDEIEQIVDGIRGMNDTRALAAVVRSFREFRPDRMKLEANPVPTLGLIGEHDTNLPALRKTAAYMAKLEVEIIDGVDHVQAFRTPAFIAGIESFLATHSIRAWSRFRGPDGGGFVPGDALPAELGLANLAWKSAAPFGQSSPILVGDQVVLTAADEEAFTVVAYDTDSGQERWRHVVARERRTEVYPDNDAASPTPVTDGETVYAYFPDLGLIALSADGEERWRHPLPAFRNLYGMASSPVLADGIVLLQLDNQEQSQLLAVNRETGKARWTTLRDREASWTTPLVLDSPQGQVLLAAGALWLDAYDAATGKELWSWYGVGHDALASPVYVDGRLYVLQAGNFGVPGYDALLTSDEDGDGVVSVVELAARGFGAHAGFFDEDGDDLVQRAEWEHFLEGNASGTHGLTVVDLPDPSKAPVGLRWRYEMGGAIVPGPTVAGHLVFAVRDGGILAALDRDTGELLRRERLPEAKGRYFASPVGDEGKLYFASERGTVSVVAPEAEWSVISRSELGSKVGATPAIRGSWLYVRTHDALLAFRAGSR